MSKISGSCLCGAIHYHSESAPTRLTASDCRHCQKHAGVAISMSVGILEKTLRVRGLMPSVYEDIRSSGSVVLRSFCPECGTPLFTERDSEPTMIFINAATLDDDSWIQPQVFHKPMRRQQTVRSTAQGQRTAQVLEWPEDERRLKVS
jgi:hypothetical protein